MPDSIKIVTENNYPNRKIKYQAYVRRKSNGNYCYSWPVNSFHAFGISIQGVDANNLTDILKGVGPQCHWRRYG